MNVLVTGASGFIGSHLVELLISKGHSVRSLVEKNSDLSFLSRICTEIFYGDLRNIESLKEATCNIDIVYHLAAISRLNIDIPLKEYTAVNAEGTRNLIEAGRLSNVKKFVYVSSIEAVGPSLDGRPLNEMTIPHPKDVYGTTKLEGERIVTEYYKKYRMHVVIIRPPTTYGPRELMLLKRLFSVINKGYFLIVGNGRTLMEFCYVKNQALGIMLAGEYGKPGEVYFVSDERPYSINEVVNEIGRQLNINVKIFHMPIFIGLSAGLCAEIMSKLFRFHPFRIKETGRSPFSRKTVMWMTERPYFCDISKAKKEIGYTPLFSLSDGIKETISWYKENGLLKNG